MTSTTSIATGPSVYRSNSDVDHVQAVGRNHDRTSQFWVPGSSVAWNIMIAWVCGISGASLVVLEHHTGSRISYRKKERPSAR